MKQKTLTLLLGCFFFSNTVNAQNINAFYIGHSLSDGVIDMVHSLANNYRSGSFNFRYQSIPGSPLRWNWQAKDRNDYTLVNHFYSAFYNSTYGLPAGNYNVLVLTESVPRHISIIDDTYQYADSFYSYAVRHNPGIKIYLYEVWHCILSGTPNPCAYDVPASNWRQRLINDYPMWKSVTDSLNRKYKPAKPVCLIPAGQGLAALYDSIQAQVIPGISTINQLFSDDIHMNDIGRYFIACIHFAMIHGVSPEGLTNQLTNMWGVPYTAPTPVQAAKFQQIAWRVVSQYYSACTGTVTSVNEVPVQQNTMLVYPNPVTSSFVIESSDAFTNYELYNSSGMLVKKGNGKTVNIAGLAQGIYFVKTINGYARFIKL